MHVHGHILHIVMQVANKTKRVSFFTIVPFRFLYSLIVLNLLVNYIIHTIYLSKKGQKSHQNTISSTGTIQLPVDSPQWPVIRSNIYLLEYISYLIIIYNIHVQGQCLCLPEFALTGSLRASRSYPRCLPHRLNANHRTVCQSRDIVAR